LAVQEPNVCPLSIQDAWEDPASTVTRKRRDPELIEPNLGFCERFHNLRLCYAGQVVEAFSRRSGFHPERNRQVGGLGWYDSKRASGVLVAHGPNICDQI